MRKPQIKSLVAIYAFLSVLYLIVFPLIVFYGSHLLPKSILAKINLYLIIYLFAVGILYLVSTICVFRSKDIGHILGLIASWIGIIPWLASILSGGYLLLRKEVKGIKSNP